MDYGKSGSGTARGINLGTEPTQRTLIGDLAATREQSSQTTIRLAQVVSVLRDKLGVPPIPEGPPNGNKNVEQPGLAGLSEALDAESRNQSVLLNDLESLVARL